MSLAWRSEISLDRWTRAEAMAAPIRAGCSGPEKIIVLPQVRMRRAVSASGSARTAPPAENPLASEPTITVRGGSGPSPSSVPRPCRPRPAEAVGVVEIETELLVPRHQLPQRRERRRIAVHAVDAVGSRYQTRR